MTLLEFLIENRVPVKGGGEHHHVSAGWLGVDCPACSPGSGRYRLGFSARGRANCWTCGPVHAAEALAALTGLPFARVRKVLGALDRGAPPPKEDRPRGTYKEPPGVGELLPAHRRYLRGRGFDPDALARLWGLRGIGLAGRLPWRLFIPVTCGGRPASWTTRAVTDDVGRRYVNARPGEEALPARSLLYGEDLARGAAVVVEGPADAWRVGPGAVATLGMGVTPAQVRRIARFPARAVCFDSEPAARRRAEALCAALKVLPGATYRVELDAKDPGEASPREVRKLRKAFLD